jgi:DNA primase catalytic core
MPLIPDDEIERIKRETDLAAVIRSRGMALKPQGGDLVGLCPFHDDHDPSLRVTPGKGLWRCMASACGATGNVIQFVQRFDGVSFRHAVELLKSGKLSALCGPAKGAPVVRTRVPKLGSPLAPDADDQAALRQVLDYYHTRLKENPAALAYLEKRGLKNDEAIAAFKLGVADRTLGLRLPPKQRKDGEAIRTRLEKLGLYRESGHEHMNGRIVFPVIAENGEIGTAYGRAIGKVEKNERHLFLSGPLRGVWNPACLRSPEVIITEGIIDALTFWCAGYRNVTTSYSAKGLPEELLDALVTAKVRLVFIAFDRDESGDKGAEGAAAQLMARGIECRRVLFPHGFDANRYALEVTPPAKSLGVLLNAAQWLGKGKVSSHVAPAPSSLAAKAASVAAPVAPVPEVKPAPNGAATSVPASAAKEEKSSVPMAVNPPAAPSLQLRGEHWFLTLDGREYRVGSLEKTLGSGALKIVLRLKAGQESQGGTPSFHLDAIDLARDPERRRFIERAAEETGLHADLLKRDLGRLLLAVEQAQAELARPAKPGPSIVPLTPELLAAASAFLRNPNLWDLIPEHAALCGIAGECLNVRVGYLAAVSRLLDRPIMIILQSSTAAGKTTLMDAILAFMPPERRIKYSAMTGQALFYMGGADLAHKILAIVEEEGAEKASYALKLLQSEGELRIASTGKDPHTGRMETQEYHLQGPVMIFLTTTSHTINDELQNRALILTVDESREQTERIHALQREARTEAGLERKARRDELLALHRAAQSLLQSLPVFNPYGDKLRFLSNQLRTRRDHEKYLLLIDSLALLFQHQRGRKVIAGREHVVATLDDIARANELAHEVLGRSMDDMPPQARRLLGLVQQMQRERAKKAKGSDGGHWRRRDLRAFTGWSDTALKVHLARLVELEYVLPSRDPEHLNGQLYELLFDGDVDAQHPHLSGLIDVETLRASTYEENRSGLNGDRSGVGQPLVRGQSGVGQGGKNGVSSSENGVPEAKTAENSRPGAAGTKAA